MSSSQDKDKDYAAHINKPGGIYTEEKFKGTLEQPAQERQDQKAKIQKRSIPYESEGGAGASSQFSGK